MGGWLVVVAGGSVRAGGMRNGMEWKGLFVCAAADRSGVCTLPLRMDRRYVYSLSLSFSVSHGLVAWSGAGPICYLALRVS